MRATLATAPLRLQGANLHFRPERRGGHSPPRVQRGVNHLHGGPIRAAAQRYSGCVRARMIRRPEVAQCVWRGGVGGGWVRERGRSLKTV